LRIGRDLDQVQTFFTRHLDGFAGGDNTQLFASLINETDFSDTDLVIDTLR
jgi:hypothetical protein